MYKIKIDDRAEKQLDELPQDIFEKVNEVIFSFQHQPRPRGVKKLEGVENGWRIEVRRKY